MARIRVGMIVADERDVFFQYDRSEPYFGTAPTALLEGLKQCPDVEVHVVSCVRQPVRQPERLAENTFYHSVLISRWAFLRTLYLPCVLKVRARLRRIRPDIVHGQGSERYQALAAVFSGYPNVMTIHGIMASSWGVLHSAPTGFYWTTGQLERIALRKAGGVFCNSNYTQKALSSWARRTWLVPNPVRTTFLSSPLSAARSPRPTLLHVGVICENKQQREMLQLARRLWQQKLDFEVQFIGVAARGTPYGRAFLDEIGQAERDGYARYLGTRSAEELVQCFDRASALVHTPVTETFGLVVAEALARNLKFFGFRVGGVPDIVEGAAGAELVPPNDWPALAAAITNWLQAGAPAPPPNAGLVQNRYRPLAIARRHLAIYREVLSSG